MERFIPYEKLSKKKRRALNAKRREIWPISPITRKPENPKAYNRKKAQRRDYDDSRSVPFLYFIICLFRIEQTGFTMRQDFVGCAPTDILYCFCIVNML